MNWRPWRKKDYEPITYIKTVSMPTLARWYLYDTETRDPNQLAAAIGLTQVSEEGEDTERKASDLRSEKVEPYVSFFKSMAEINAVTLTEAQRIKDPSLDEDTVNVMHTLFAMSSYLAIYAAFSAAFELGLIDNPGAIGTTEAIDE